VLDTMLTSMEEEKKQQEPDVLDTLITEYVEEDCKTTVIAEPLEL